MQPELTAPQKAVLDAYIEAAAIGEPPPTLRELCSRFGWSSTATARDHLRALVRKGALRREHGSRNYRPAERRDATAVVPVVGSVAAGQPILAVEHLDGEVTVPGAWVHRTPAFAVKVRGESMTGAGILDGDTIVARSTAT